MALKIHIILRLLLNHRKLSNLSRDTCSSAIIARDGFRSVTKLSLILKHCHVLINCDPAVSLIEFAPIDINLYSIKNQLNQLPKCK